MFTAIAAAISLSLFGSAHALNDWSVPCIYGTCSWDLDNSGNSGGGTAAGTLQISGVVNSISDITEAAGWKILDCDPNASQMNIRLVCAEDLGSCSHVYKGRAQDTIVRLPNGCGRMPFARIAREWDSEDQTVPTAVFVRRAEDGSLPIVKAMTLDMGFSAIDPGKHGQVTFNLAASTDPEAITGTIQPPNRRSRLAHKRNLNRRGFFDDSLNSFTSFNKNRTLDVPPIEFSKTLNVFNASIQCSSVEASVNIDVGVEVNAQISLSVVVSGSVVPPELDEFGIVTGVDADLLGSLDITANALGTFESPTINLFEVGIPGLDIPGILTVGPTFEISVLAKATLDTSIELKSDLSFTTKGTKIVFPPRDDNLIQGVKPGASNLKLSTTQSVKSTGNAEVHVIPQVNLGITALEFAEAKVFANIDGSVNAQLSLEASNTITSDTDLYFEGTAVPQNSTFRGCTEVGTGISVNVGADGSLFGIVEGSITKELFSRNFTLFQRCFGDSAKRDLAFVSSGSSANLIKKRDFACPETTNGTLAPVVSGILTPRELPRRGGQEETWQMRGRSAKSEGPDVLDIALQPGGGLRSARRVHYTSTDGAKIKKFGTRE